MIGCGIGIWPASLGGGASAFNPISLFGGGEQGVVYDLTNTATMFQERTGAAATTPSGANGPIGTLKDLSPNNNYCIAPSDAARPLSRQGVGAPNVYGEWDGVDDALSIVFAVSVPFTRVASWRNIAAASDSRAFGDPGGGGGGLLYQPVAPATYAAYSGATLSLGASNLCSPGEDVVVTAVYNGISSSVQKNVATEITGDVGATVPSGVVLGANTDANLFSSMRIYRVVQISRILTALEIAQCRTWCGAAAGLAL